MGTIQFTTVIGPDGVIRPPVGVSLPDGRVEVIVRRGASNGTPTDQSLTLDWLLELAREAEEADPNLPADLAERHDYYAHGKPKS